MWPANASAANLLLTGLFTAADACGENCSVVEAGQILERYTDSQSFINALATSNALGVFTSANFKTNASIYANGPKLVYIPW